MSVYCKDCDNVCFETRQQEPWRWRCLKVPVAPGFKFVSPDYSPSPPYARCDQVNTDGQCQYFEPARVPPDEKET